MAKNRYIYDQKSCQFVPYKPSLKANAFKISGFLILSTVLGVIFFIGYSLSFNSPQEVRLARENEGLQQKYSQLTDRFEEQFNRLEKIQFRDDYIYRPVFEAQPLGSSIRKAGVGGAERSSFVSSVDVPSSEKVLNLYMELDQMKRQLYIQSKSFDEILVLAKNKSNMLSSIPAIQPIPKGNYRMISSGFGYRRDPILGIPKFHAGVDFAARRGTKLVSTGDGKVIFAGYKSGYGNTVIIDHGYGYQTIYAHCSKLLVKSGQLVKRGFPIGKVGSTGKSTGEHLHYEVVRNGRKVNPINYFFHDLEEEEYELMHVVAKKEQHHHHEDHF